MKGKTIRKLTAEQYIKIPVITWRNYPEETRHESNPHLAPRLPWTAMNMLSKSWEIPHPHGLTMPSNTIKIPHITPHRPEVGGGGSGFQLISVLRNHCPYCNHEIKMGVTVLVFVLRTNCIPWAFQNGMYMKGRRKTWKLRFYGIYIETSQLGRNWW